MKAIGIVLSIDGLDHIAILKEVRHTMRILVGDYSLMALGEIERLGEGGWYISCRRVLYCFAAK